MHPNIKSATVSRCPKCGMDLIQIKDQKSKMKNQEHEHMDHELKTHS